MIRIINQNNFHYLYRIGKKTRPFFLKRRGRFYKYYHIKEKSENANNLIIELIKSNKPFMIARFGSVESRAIVNYLLQNELSFDIINCINYLIGRIGYNWKYSSKYMNQLCLNAGFFPNNEQLLPIFVHIYLESAKKIDILGVWNELEEYIPTIPNSTMICNLRELEPWFFKNPWTKALEGKKVLVIHPFSETIKSQYLNRENIYKNNEILPEFTLKTIKAVQTIADEESEFSSWFEALEYMKNQILKEDFDIAIIGCGAYGFPLASFVKDIGKQAIHLGGVTQLLFGIKGKRWENWIEYTSLRKDGWVSPLEIPKGFEKIEGGCYW